ncbi:hypothetical protein C804_05268 [Lachnospiraceae bacterium A4]|nr:hypothetical protein C804_05268 [Lachnospiraceae bacterium A4]
MYLKRLLCVHKGVKKIPGNDTVIDSRNPVYIKTLLGVGYKFDMQSTEKAVQGL